MIINFCIASNYIATTVTVQHLHLLTHLTLTIIQRVRYLYLLLQTRHQSTEKFSQLLKVTQLVSKGQSWAVNPSNLAPDCMFLTSIPPCIY